MGDNFPYFHPLYAGQMLKPPHPVARAAYALAMRLNPNNHALDGGRASSRMEVEAVREIAAMFGWSEFLGHLTSGGTFANLEALWVAGQMAPGKKVVASDQAHYTHSRISAVLKLPFASVAADDRGRMDLARSGRGAQGRRIGTVVATLGTTALGSVDPLDRDSRTCGRSMDSGSTWTRPTAAIFGWRRIWTRRRSGRLSASARRIRLSSIRTSMGCSPTAAAASCFAIRPWGGGTSTSRRTPTSPRRSCILGEISLECSRARCVGGGVVGDAAAAASGARRGVCPRAGEGQGGGAPAASHRSRPIRILSPGRCRSWTL